jgi:hypothetical protein
MSRYELQWRECSILIPTIFLIGLISGCGKTSEGKKGGAIHTKSIRLCMDPFASKLFDVKFSGVSNEINSYVGAGKLTEFFANLEVIPTVAFRKLFEEEGENGVEVDVDFRVWWETKTGYIDTGVPDARVSIRHDQDYASKVKIELYSEPLNEPTYNYVTAYIFFEIDTRSRRTKVKLRSMGQGKSRTSLAEIYKSELPESYLEKVKLLKEKKRVIANELSKLSHKLDAGAIDKSGYYQGRRKLFLKHYRPVLDSLTTLKFKP